MIIIKTKNPRISESCQIDLMVWITLQAQTGVSRIIPTNATTIYWLLCFLKLHNLCSIIHIVNNKTNLTINTTLQDNLFTRIRQGTPAPPFTTRVLIVFLHSRWSLENNVANPVSPRKYNKTTLAELFCYLWAIQDLNLWPSQRQWDALANWANRPLHGIYLPCHKNLPLSYKWKWN